jgi:uncharacterized damage-inducible protein DinB
LLGDGQSATLIGAKMIDLLAWALQQSRQQTLQLVADLDNDLLDHQPAPGMNHPAWVLGHLLALDALLLSWLVPEQGSSIETEWMQTYGPSSAAVSLRDKFLPKQVYLDRLRETGKRLQTALQGKTVADLAREHPKPASRSVFPTLGHVLQYALWHEGYHGGQLSAWRRVQGLPTVGVSFFGANGTSS